MIAIKSMKNMPNKCVECGLKSGGYCYHKTQPYNLSESDMLKEKPKDCPLVEIVTCQDCKHCHPDEDGRGCHCERDNYVRFSVYGDFFCKDGER